MRRACQAVDAWDILKSILCHWVGILSFPDGQDFAALGIELGKVKSGTCEGLGRRAGLPDHVVVTQWHGGKRVWRPVQACAKDGLGLFGGDVKGEGFRMTCVGADHAGVSEKGSATIWWASC